MWELAENYYDEEIIAKLMSVLDEHDTNYRRAAVKTLGEIGHATVPQLVQAMLNSDNVTMRGSATKAIAQVVIILSSHCHPKVCKV